jgi:hypothetical protein
MTAIVQQQLPVFLSYQRGSSFKEDGFVEIVHSADHPDKYIGGLRHTGYSAIPSMSIDSGLE